MNKHSEEIAWTNADEAAANAAAAEISGYEEDPGELAELEGVNESVAQIEQYLQEQDDEARRQEGSHK